MKRILFSTTHFYKHFYIKMNLIPKQMMFNPVLGILVIEIWCFERLGQLGNLIYEITYHSLVVVFLFPQSSSVFEIYYKIWNGLTCNYFRYLELLEKSGIASNINTTEVSQLYLKIKISPCVIFAVESIYIIK